MHLKELALAAFVCSGAMAEDLPPDAQPLGPGADVIQQPVWLYVPDAVEPPPATTPEGELYFDSVNLN